MNLVSLFSLEEYRRKERERDLATVVRVANSAAYESSESDGEDAPRMATGGGGAHVRSGRVRHDIVVRSEGRNSSVPHFFKTSKKNPTMFPYFEEKIKFDEYDEIIRPEDYVITEAEDMMDVTDDEMLDNWTQEMPASLLSWQKFFIKKKLYIFGLAGGCRVADQMHQHNDAARHQRSCHVHRFRKQI